MVPAMEFDPRRMEDFTFTVNTVGGTEIFISSRGYDYFDKICKTLAATLDVHWDMVDIVVAGQSVYAGASLYQHGLCAGTPQPAVHVVVRQSPCGHPRCGWRCTGNVRLLE